MVEWASMKYKKTILPNGVRVLTIPMPSFESATVLVMVGAGSRYETKKNNGISHFLEHMAFKGTKKRPTALEISTLIDGIGGESNAFTSKEFTGYFVKSAVSHVELSMDVISDMLQNSLFDTAEIDKERGVIIEEMNLFEDTPMRKIGDIYEKLLFGDTPMGWDIAGEKEIIQKITREDFISYLKSLYSGDNITVIVAGGIDPEKTVEMVKKYFGGMEKFDTLKFKKLVVDQKKPRVVLKKKTTEQVHIAIGVPTVSLSHKDKYPLSVLSAILGGGMSSRLFHEVREKRGLAYYVRTNSENYQDVGTLVSFAGIDAKRADEAVKVIVDEYKTIANPKNRISKTELKKAKEYLKGHLVLELEDSRSVAVYYGSQELLEDSIENPNDVLVNIDKVTAEDVERVAQKYLVPSKLNLAIIGNFDNGQKFEKLLS